MITLVPKGGLGNRINAICTAIAYCRQKNRPLNIVWFNEYGMRCPYEKLFTLSVDPSQIEIRNAGLADKILRDQPRKKNLWIPAYFEKRMFDKCIYWYEGFDVKEKNIPYSDELEPYKNLLLIICGRYWESKDMWKVIRPASQIEALVTEKTTHFAPHTIGIHIRRTDNMNTTRFSPTELYVKVMQEEISKDNEVKFFLASDSLEEKKHLTGMFGERIMTTFDQTTRETEQGITDAFVEMIVLGKCNKIYAGDSSFADIASKLGETAYIRLETGR